MSAFLNKISSKTQGSTIDLEKFALSRDIEHGLADNGEQDRAVFSEGHGSLAHELDEPVIDDAELESEGVEEDDDEHLEPNTTTSSLHHRGSFSGFSLFSTASVDLRYHPRSGPPQWWIKLKAFLYPPDPQNDPSGSSFIPNYRYTPIFSAVIIPFSILLEIPGLTGNWYIRTVNNQTVEKRSNPILLDVALGISMGCALVANVALIVRFLEKNVKLMTIVCVVFLTLHDLINIIAVTTFGVENRFDDGFTYGQSFWMTLCSTIASTFTNAGLITDFLRTPDFASSGSGLTRKQRSLVIMVIILLVYVAFGALIQTILLELNFIDALYFTICSIEAIGFGDIPPVTTGSKVFICFYAIFGIINLALAVSLTRETVLEALEVGYRKRVHAARVKRKTLRWRKRVAHRWREAVEWRLREKGYPIWVMDSSQNAGVSGFIRHWVLLFVDKTFPQWTWRSKWKGLGAVAHPKGMHLNLEALEGLALESAAMEAGVPLSELLPPGFAKRWAERHDLTSDEETRSISVSSTTSASTPLSRRNSDSNSIPSRLNPWMTRLKNAQKDYKQDTDTIPLTYARLGRMVAMLGGFALAVNKPGALKRSARGASSQPTKANPANGGPSLTTSSSIKEQRSISQQYDAYRIAMEREEVKAFYARLTVVWTLFLVFWLVGSGVFMVTEGWSFGIAMYFCVIAFTTIGYGDYSPKTPAGRSIFVGWALLGVATMTILISVVAEAYTSRYKNVLQSTKIFDRAVSRYKAREKAKTLVKSQKKPKVPPPATTLSSPPPPSLTSTQIPKLLPKEANAESAPHPQSSGTHTHLPTKGSGFGNLSHIIRQVDGKLEELPRRILSHAQLFSEHLQYFVGPGSVGANGGPSQGQEIPTCLKNLMDDIAGASKFGERIQTEILQDAEARQTLFTLSIEKALRKMIEAAEDAIESLEERNRLLAVEHDDNGEQIETLPAARSSEIRFSTI
ncbi:hypothetical protein J3R30DRAFT_3579783 [Lentinula aciculospora]|uniref:Potassium channel domain-containing protein n=1 Tax=Lentinula aciculospora TaxID=153920 RepID=A0A9W8ZUR9_9AGAR|nr:hypothetical protein J3R30DRAFT_3579783 [Lentinula aciculospora]